MVDKSQMVATSLAKRGIPVGVDYQYKIVHDKFFVVDSELTEENFSLRRGRAQGCKECSGTAR